MSQSDSHLPLREELAHYVGKNVILDTSSTFLYIGRLDSIGHHVATLHDVDVHSLADSTTTRDLYILQTQQHGVRRNRRQASVFVREIVSVSLLEDAVVF
jgi:hypothetical protein